MKTEQFVEDLRIEHAEVMKKVANVKFELAVLELDKEEKSRLDMQRYHMEQYAEELANRAAYAIEKENKSKMIETFEFDKDLIPDIKNRKVTKLED
jgi:hypothetical protein